MVPRVDDWEVGLKLALVGRTGCRSTAPGDSLISQLGMLRDGAVPPDVLADYLLFTLNKFKSFE